MARDPADKNRSKPQTEEEGAPEVHEEEDLTPAQRAHSAFNKEAAKIRPLKRLIAEREHERKDTSALRKMLKETEAELKVLEKELAQRRRESSGGESP